MKKYRRSILAAVLAGMISISCTALAEETTSGTENGQAANTSVMPEGTIYQQNFTREYAEITYMYPQLQTRGSVPAGIESAINQINEISMELGIEERSSESSRLHVRLTRLDDRVISFQISGDFMYRTYGYTYDTSTGKLLTLSDITSDSDALMVKLDEPWYQEERSGWIDFLSYKWDEHTDLFLNGQSWWFAADGMHSSAFIDVGVSYQELEEILYPEFIPEEKASWMAPMASNTAGDEHAYYQIETPEGDLYTLKECASESDGETILKESSIMVTKNVAYQKDGKELLPSDDWVFKVRNAYFVRCLGRDYIYLQLLRWESEYLDSDGFHEIQAPDYLMVIDLNGDEPEVIYEEELMIDEASLSPEYFYVSYPDEENKKYACRVNEAGIPELLGDSFYGITEEAISEQLPSEQETEPEAGNEGEELAADGEQATDTAVSAMTPEIYQKYGEMIEAWLSQLEIAKAETGYAENLDYEVFTDSYRMRAYCGNVSALEAFFTLYDLNRDGLDELFIGLKDQDPSSLSYEPGIFEIFCWNSETGLAEKVTPDDMGIYWMADDTIMEGFAQGYAQYDFCVFTGASFIIEECYSREDEWFHGVSTYSGEFPVDEETYWESFEWTDATYQDLNDEVSSRGLKTITVYPANEINIEALKQGDRGVFSEGFEYTESYDPYEG